MKKEIVIEEVIAESRVAKEFTVCDLKNLAAMIAGSSSQNCALVCAYHTLNAMCNPLLEALHKQIVASENYNKARELALRYASINYESGIDEEENLEVELDYKPLSLKALNSLLDELF